MAFRVKFDETAQVMWAAESVKEDQEDEEAMATRTIATVICMAIRAFVCSTALPRGGYHWACPLQFLRRGKAECMWEGLQRALGCFRPFAASEAQYSFPSGSQVRWCWYVFNTDSAKACKRLLAHAEKKVLEVKGSLFVVLYCLIHIVYLPLKRILDKTRLCGKMYRAVLVMHGGAYHHAFMKNILRNVAANVVPVHNYEPSEEDKANLEAVLQIGLRLPSRAGCSSGGWTRADVQLAAECKDTFVGDPTSTTILVKCDGSCNGDKAVCNKNAVSKAKKLVTRLHFRKTIPRPAANRWWKCVPVCRALLLGVAFHGLFRFAPTGVRGRKRSAPYRFLS